MFIFSLSDLTGGIGDWMVRSGKLQEQKKPARGGPLDESIATTQMQDLAILKCRITFASRIADILISYQVLRVDYPLMRLAS